MGPTSKNVKTHHTPAESSKILHADENWGKLEARLQLPGSCQLPQLPTGNDLTRSRILCSPVHVFL